MYDLPTKLRNLPEVSCFQDKKAPTSLARAVVLWFCQLDFIFS